MLKSNFKAIYDSYHLNGRYDTLADFHLKSMNKFVSEDLTKILLGYNPITIEETVNDKKISGILEFTDLYCSPPFCTGADQKKRPQYPNECRILDKNYNFNIFVHYKFSINEKTGNEPEKMKFMINSMEKNEPLLLGKVPLMVKTELCSLYGLTPDQLELVKEDRDERGCYFIVGGNEYAIIPQENKAENFIFKNIESKDKKTEYNVWIQSKRSGHYEYPYYTMVSLTAPNSIPQIKIAVTISKSKGAYIPLKVIFMSLGILSAKDIFDLICENEDKQVQDIILEILSSPIYLDKQLYEIKTRKDAIMYIVDLYKKKNKYYVFKSANEEEVIKNLIFEMNEKQLLPHIGGESEMKKKVLFLGQMVKDSVRLYLGYDEPVDRDNYGNKRILSPGILMGQLFKHSTDILINDAKNGIRKELTGYDQEKDYSMIIINNFKEKKINISKNIATGKWPAGFTKKEKEGISQLREIKSAMDRLTYMNKINTPVLDQNTTGVNIRALHESTFGFIDPADSPDGANVGLIKHIAHMTVISEYIDETFLIKLIRNSTGVIDVDNMVFSEIGKYVKIYINGTWYFCIVMEKLVEFVSDLLSKRRKGIIHRHTSIVRNYEQRTIRILTDGGRLLKPALILNPNNKLRITPEHFDDLRSGKMTFDDLISKEILEYVDIHETEYNCTIAKTEEDLSSDIHYTHCDIDESIILSLNSLMTPFANYNQGPRVSFQNTMRKQTIGHNLTNYKYRMDKSYNYLPYAQRPLTCTIGEKYTGLDVKPYGTNLYIAIAQGEGKNLDDATIVNEDSMVSNDIMTVINYKTYVDSLEGKDEEFLKPVPTKCDKYKHIESYAAVGNDGLPIIGAVVNKGDVITGHVQILSKTEKAKGRYEYVDRTLSYSESIPGVIESYNLSENEDGVRTLKIKIRLLRKLKLGDKMASTASQKGIVAGMTPAEEMIYDEDGNVPDVVFNPHGIITRMTMSHLYEIMTCNIALTSGTRVDATPFCRITAEDIIERATELGLSPYGEKTFYDGKTGKKIRCQIYSGFIYYQRLKHMVDDKIFARGSGRIVSKTKLPIQGRKTGGGLRIGGMEKDTMVGHGVPYVLKEFFFDKADKFEEHVSGISGMFVTGNVDDKGYSIIEDRGNKGSLDIDRTHIPWTTKMLQEYLASGFGIGMSMETEQDMI